MSSPAKKSNIFSSDNTKKYDRQVGFLATVEQFHFYLVANRFPVKLTGNLVSVGVYSPHSLNAAKQ